MIADTDTLGRWRRAGVTTLAWLALSCAGDGPNVDDVPQAADPGADETARRTPGNDASDAMPERLSIEDAHAELVEELRELDGLTMIGIGESDGAPCLRVYVVAINDEIEARVPAAHRGWPVELRESGPIRARRE